MKESKVVKTIFIGTAGFAIPVLESLMSLDFINLTHVITQPDKPAGRRQELKASPVKELILDKGYDVEILQPEKVREISDDIINNIQPELIIVAAYGQIIPKTILEYPIYGVLNLHGSILPELRGAVPVHMAILQGLKETGVSMQKMVLEMDAGPIISERKVDISTEETTETLMNKLGILAAEIVKVDLERWINGEIEAKEQDESLATYCYMDDISKEKAEITYDTPVELSERMVRAFYPWPVAWFKLEDGKRVKVFKARVKEVSQIKSGELKLVRVDGELCLEVKDGMLQLEELQLEGKRRDSGKNYLYLAN